MNKLSVGIKVAQNAHPEEKVHRYQTMRREMGNKLLDFLSEQKSLVAIEVVEHRYTILDFGVPYDIITLSAQTKNVKHHHVVAHAPAPIDYVPDTAKKTLFERMRGFFRE